MKPFTVPSLLPAFIITFTNPTNAFVTSPFQLSSKYSYNNGDNNKAEITLVTHAIKSSSSSSSSSRTRTRTTNNNNNNNNNNNKYKPTLETIKFNQSLNNLAKSAYSNRNAAQEAQDRLLDALEYEHEQNFANSSSNADANADAVIKVDKISFSTVMKAWIKSSHPKRVEKAEALLMKMEELSSVVLDDIQNDNIQNDHVDRFDPDVVSYSSMIHAWSKSRQSYAPQRALDLFNRLYQRYEDTRDENLKPNVITWTNVIQALARGGLVHEAEDMLDKMESNAAKNHPAADDDIDIDMDSSLQPNDVAYTALITAYARKMDVDSAELMLQRMERMYQAGNTRVRPTAASYTAIMDAHARQKNSHRSAIQAENTYKRLEQLYRQTGECESTLKPDAVAVKLVMKAWANARQADSAEKVEEFLNVALSDDSLRPKVDVGMYNIVLTAWSMSDRSDNVERAEAVLEGLEARYENVKNDAWKPSHYTLDCMLDVLARSSKKLNHRTIIQKVDSILHRMTSVYGYRPDDNNAETYKRAINALVNVQQPSDDIINRCELCLQKMEFGHQKQIPNSALQPDIFVYNSVVTAMAQIKNCATTAHRAEALLKRMQTRVADRISDVAPDKYTWTAVLNAWARSGDFHAANYVERIFGEMRDAGIEPETISYNALLQSHATSASGSAERAEALLNSMIRRSSSSRNDEGKGEQDYPNSAEYPKPNNLSFYHVIDAWTRSGLPNCGRRAEDVFRSMNDIAQNYQVNTFAYNKLLFAWSQPNAGAGAAQRVLDILQEMDLLYGGGNDDVEPDAMTYNTVIAALARHGDPVQAEEVLSRMIQFCKSGTNLELKPNRVTYSAVIGAWSRSTKEGAARRAEQILKQMERLYNHQDDHGDNNNNNAESKPDVIAYTSVLNAFARSSEEGSAERAESLLNYMEAEYKNNNNVDMKPNVRCYNAVIQAWGASNDVRASFKAIEIFQHMVQQFESSGDTSVKPNIHTFNAIISTLARSSTHDKDAAKKAREILNRMEKMYLAGDYSVKPDIATYSSVINALAKSSYPDRAQQAEHMLKHIQKLPERGIDGVVANRITYNTVIDAWAKSDDIEAAQNAEQIFDAMQRLYLEGNSPEVKPDRISYSNVINAWSQSPLEGAAEKAEEWLTKMEEAAQNGDENHNLELRPNYIVYNSVLAAWARDAQEGSVRRAELVLRRMKAAYDGGNRDAKPGLASYNALIYAWSLSDRKEAPEKAEGILSFLQRISAKGQDDLTPNVITMQSVLGCYTRNYRIDAIERIEELKEIIRRMSTKIAVQ